MITIVIIAKKPAVGRPRRERKLMSLQDDSSALRKDLEAKIGDKIKFIDRETEALLQSGIIKNSLQDRNLPSFWQINKSSLSPFSRTTKI